MLNHKIIFICGLHRSGTSIFYKSLLDHEKICGFENTGVPEDEGQHLQAVFPPAHDLGGPGLFGFNPEAHLTETSSLITDENKSKLVGEWGRYITPDKPFMIEKSPPNILRTRFFQEIFPNAYFILIMRHPIATSYATKKMTSEKYRHSLVSLNKLIKHWLICHEIFLEDMKQLKKSLIVKYEDFVEKPNHELNRVYEFLGINGSPVKREVKSDINALYFDRWHKLKNSIFTNLYVRLMIKRFSKRVTALGYSMND